MSNHLLRRRHHTNEGNRTNPEQTTGQVEAEIATAVVLFYRVRLGRGPDEVRAFLLDDMVLVRQHGTLTPAERYLVDTPGGWDLVRQMRRKLVDSARADLADLIGRLTGQHVVGLFSDTSRDGDSIDVFTLAPSHAAS